MPHAIDPSKPCIFCHLDRPILAESSLALAFADAYPVSPGHTLIVPKRHVRTIFDTTDEEYAACFALAREVRKLLIQSHQPHGFNLGVNCEVAGGQSVWHAHLHLIPRYDGDAEDPLGGVRNVIPRKRKPDASSGP
jgi:diadenosine tetraphosphate (Ap4A) HIT family hydrolase